MSYERHETLTEIRARRNIDKFSRGVLTFVVGLQFGSEAKGSIVQYLSPAASNAVRTGAVNAGHTVYYRGDSHVMRQLPSAWINPYTNLVLGAGALISPSVLMAEIERCEKEVPIRNRLLIDRNAHVITEEHIVEEAEGDLAERIGSTSSRGREGIGTAMAAKVLRSARSIQAKDFEPLKQYITNTSDHLNGELEMGADVLVEGTQGFGLSIDHGVFPYVTSRNATVSALADSIGVQPDFYQTNIIGVARTYPIRVAGNSGPFGEGSEELTWDQMKEWVGDDKLMPEKTSVTGLPRRVATFSERQYIDACRINRPTEIALTFADYLDKSIYRASEVGSSKAVMNFIDYLEELYSPAPVTLVNTGPNSTVDLDWSRMSQLDRLRDWD